MENQCVDPEKREEKIEKRKQRNCSHHSNIFSQDTDIARYIYICIYIDAYFR
jgi:hypothetical protein